MPRKLKTTTLMRHHDPVSVICPGHVDAKTFNQAFKNEGWKSPGQYKQADLKYIYMTKRKSKNPDYTHFFKQVSPSVKGAKPYTSTSWD